MFYIVDMCLMVTFMLFIGDLWDCCMLWVSVNQYHLVFKCYVHKNKVDVQFYILRIGFLPSHR